MAGKTSQTPKRKVPSQARLKKELDRLWSLLTRATRAVDGFCRCYTCGRLVPFKEVHCGHFIPRNYTATRWHEDNCRPQCVGCNIFGNGKVFDFEENLVKELGRARVERLKALRHQVFKVDVLWYLKKISTVKSKLTALQVSW